MLALEYQDTKQDGVPDVCACVIVKKKKKGIYRRSSKKKKKSYEHIAGVFVLQVCIVVHIHSEFCSCDHFSRKILQIYLQTLRFCYLILKCKNTIACTVCGQVEQ